MSEERSTKWMTTFADLLSLLLTFFILLFSMSEIKRKEWEELTASLQNRLNPAHTDVTVMDNNALPPPRTRRNEGTNLHYLQNVLERKLTDALGDGRVTLAMEGDRLLVSMSTDALFSPSSAEFATDGVPAMRIIANAMANLSNKMVVVGHTDPRPIRTAQYPSNWELSLARSYAVANLIRGAGYRHGIEVFGMAAGAYGEIEKMQDLDEKARFRLARRVDIAIMRTKD